MFKNLFQFLFNKTHRIKQGTVLTYNLSNEYRYIPQWWFIWWHNYWYQIGYEFYIPTSFETLDESRAFLYRKHFGWWKHKEFEEKLKYFKYKE